MIAEKQKNASIGVGVGIVLEIAGRVLTNHPMPLLAIGIVVGLAGAVAFIWGCANYAEGKGYSPFLGLLGLISCLGLLILMFLPDKNKGGPPIGGGPVGSSPGAWPPPPSR